MRLNITTESHTALTRLKSQLLANGPRSAPHVRTTLKRVEAALDRIGNGAFGVCPDCYKVIPVAELLMRPYVEQCPACRGRKAAAA